MSFPAISNPDLAGGNQRLPYFDTYIDAVTVETSPGVYAIRTTSGGGGGGDATAANQVTQIGIETNIYAAMATAALQGDTNTLLGNIKDGLITRSLKVQKVPAGGDFIETDVLVISLVVAATNSYVGLAGAFAGVTSGLSYFEMTMIQQAINTKTMPLAINNVTIDTYKTGIKDLESAISDVYVYYFQ